LWRLEARGRGPKFRGNCEEEAEKFYYGHSPILEPKLVYVIYLKIFLSILYPKKKWFYD
jgi:hypothetical protein